VKETEQDLVVEEQKEGVFEEAETNAVEEPNTNGIDEPEKNAVEESKTNPVEEPAADKEQAEKAPGEEEPKAGFEVEEAEEEDRELNELIDDEDDGRDLGKRYFVQNMKSVFKDEISEELSARDMKRYTITRWGILTSKERYEWNKRAESAKKNGEKIEPLITDDDIEFPSGIFACMS